jgi:pseudouridine-5'-phosphate glycosidase
MQAVQSDEVREALAGGAPVVAFESTLIAHGFPRPENLEIAREMDATAREAGAVPATIAVLDGQVRVGLEEAGLRRVAEADDIAKCSLRDLAYLIASGGNGATTVAATARIASAAGIRVFATGGIGGVHRHQGGPPDVSADLHELARGPIAVVSSGAKSILDLPATVEMLETLGVPAIGYRCDEFPAFHTGASGLKLRHRVESLAELAAVARAQLGLSAGGLLVCNPPPAELAMAPDEVDALVAASLDEARAAGIAGAELTPYALSVLDRRSGGRTRAVNRALVIANARLGAELAVVLSASSAD